LYLWLIIYVQFYIIWIFCKHKSLLKIEWLEGSLQMNEIWDMFSSNNYFEIRDISPLSVWLLWFEKHWFYSLLSSTFSWYHFYGHISVLKAFTRRWLHWLPQLRLVHWRFFVYFSSLSRTDQWRNRLHQISQWKNKQN